jgi:predicted component of viral defense system (DUF524 family)
MIIIDKQKQQPDINKDIKVSDLFHFWVIKIQAKHLDHLFRINIKSTGKDIACRIDEIKRLTQTSAIEAKNQIFNPIGRFEKWFIDHDKNLNEISDKLDKSVITRGTDDIAIDSRGCRS